MGWEEEHVRLYSKYKLLLLGDCTLVTLDKGMLVFVRFSKESYTDFAARGALRRISYFHPVSSRHGVLVALMTDDTEAYAKDIICTKGWINRAVVKIQRQFRIRFVANKIINNELVSRQLSSCVDVIRHIAEFMPVTVVATDDNWSDNWVSIENWLSLPTDVAKRRADVWRRRNEGRRDEYLRRLLQTYRGSSSIDDVIRREEVRRRLINERRHSRYSRRPQLPTLYQWIT